MSQANCFDGECNRMKLFISYPHKDRSKIEKLLEILKSGGQEPWLDEQLRAGQDWSKELSNAIATSEGIVLAITNNWVDSAYCQLEFVKAVELGKYIFPILLEKTNLPQRISQYQYVDFSEEFGPQEKVEKFLNDLVNMGTFNSQLQPQSTDSTSHREIHQKGKTNLYIENSSGTINIGE